MPSAFNAWGIQDPQIDLEWLARTRLHFRSDSSTSTTWLKEHGCIHCDICVTQHNSMQSAPNTLGEFKIQESIWNGLRAAFALSK